VDLQVLAQGGELEGGEGLEDFFHALSMTPLSAHVKALGPVVTLVHSGPGDGTGVPPDLSSRATPGGPQRCARRAPPS
jgi:hypothetical protein